MYTNFFYWIIFLLTLTKLSAQVHRASDYGYERNPTEALISAFYAKGDTMIIDTQNMEWNIEPVLIKNLKNKVILIEDGVEIIAKKSAFKKKSDVLFKFIDCDNIRIIGNGAKLCMNKSEYTDGEWRHGISLRNCKDFTIENIKISDTGGDGIYIAGTVDGSFSENIVIDQVISTNNKRQGISIISGKNVKVTNSVFQNTVGTLPGAGADLEPNSKFDRLQDIYFKDCIFRNNDHAGVSISLGKLEKESNPVSIKFENCVLQNNHSVDNKYIASEIVLGAHKTNPVEGEVIFDNCIVENSKWGLFYSRKTADAYHVTFRNCIARNICQDNSFPVIYLEVPDYRSGSFDMGGYTFDNLYLSYSSDVPVFQVRGSSLFTLNSISNTNGTITLDSPKTDYFNYIKYSESNNENVKLNIQVKQ